MTATYDEHAGRRSKHMARPACAADSFTLSTTTGSSSATRRWDSEILEDLPHVDAIVGAVGGGGLLSGVGRRCARCGRGRGLSPPSPRQRRAAGDIAPQRSREPVRRLATTRRSSMAPAATALPTMWPLLSRLVESSIVVPLSDVAAAMKLVADRCHVIMEKRRRMRGRGRPDRTHSRDRRRDRLGGNIDLGTFAKLVGALDESGANRY